MLEDLDLGDLDLDLDLDLVPSLLIEGDLRQVAAFSIRSMAWKLSRNVSTASFENVLLVL